MVISVGAMPWTDVCPKFPATPVRGGRRPVSSAPRDAVHTENPTWKSLNTMPSSPIFCMFGVSFTDGSFTLLSAQPAIKPKYNLALLVF